MLPYFVRDDGLMTRFITYRIVHLGYQKSLQQNSNLLKTWLRCGQPKIVLKVDSLSEIEELQKRAKEFGIVAEVVRDAGKTQVRKLQPLLYKLFTHFIGQLVERFQVPESTITVLGLGPHGEDLDVLVKPLKLL